jgi:hypothetical protein
MASVVNGQRFQESVEHQQQVYHSVPSTRHAKNVEKKLHADGVMTVPIRVLESVLMVAILVLKI